MICLAPRIGNEPVLTLNQDRRYKLIYRECQTDAEDRVILPARFPGLSFAPVFVDSLLPSSAPILLKPALLACRFCSISWLRKSLHL